MKQRGRERNGSLDLKKGKKNRPRSPSRRTYRDGRGRFELLKKKGKGLCASREIWSLRETSRTAGGGGRFFIYQPNPAERTSRKKKKRAIPHWGRVPFLGGGKRETPFDGGEEGKKKKGGLLGGEKGKRTPPAATGKDTMVWKGEGEECYSTIPSREGGRGPRRLRSYLRKR